MADGALLHDVVGDGRFYGLGGYQLRFESGLRGRLPHPADAGGAPAAPPADPARDRPPAGAPGGVAHRPRRRADGKRVGGVVVGRGGGGREVRADLVVDATGRGSRAPAWMEALGYARPEEEIITIGVGYTTRRYRRRTADLDGDGLVITHAQPPHGLRAGFAFPVEGDEWIVTLTGWLNDHAPADEAGFRAYARSLAAPDIAELDRARRAAGRRRRLQVPRQRPPALGAPEAPAGRLRHHRRRPVQLQPRLRPGDDGGGDGGGRPRRRPARRRPAAGLRGALLPPGVQGGGRPLEPLRRRRLRLPRHRPAPRPPARTPSTGTSATCAGRRPTTPRSPRPSSRWAICSVPRRPCSPRRSCCACCARPWPGAGAGAAPVTGRGRRTGAAPRPAPPAGRRSMA